MPRMARTVPPALALAALLAMTPLAAAQGGTGTAGVYQVSVTLTADCAALADTDGAATNGTAEEENEANGTGASSSCMTPPTIAAPIGTRMVALTVANNAGMALTLDLCPAQDDADAATNSDTDAQAGTTGTDAATTTCPAAGGASGGGTTGSEAGAGDDATANGTGGESANACIAAEGGASPGGTGPGGSASDATDAAPDQTGAAANETNGTGDADGNATPFPVTIPDGATRTLCIPISTGGDDPRLALAESGRVIGRITLDTAGTDLDGSTDATDDAGANASDDTRSAEESSGNDTPAPSILALLATLMLAAGTLRRRRG